MNQLDELNNSEVQTEPWVFGNRSTESDITVLVVDDQPSLLDLTESFLIKEKEGFAVLTAQRPEDGLDILEDNDIDAIVSDYDMPNMDGLDFLAEIRKRHEDIPFILFTGKGSEEIASEAISKGVTDYLQKATGASQYSLLANRLYNAVEKHRAQQDLEKSHEKFSKIVENSPGMIGIINQSGEFDYITPTCERLLGYDQEMLIGKNAFDYMPPKDRKDSMEKFFEAIENPEMRPVIEHKFKKKDGGTITMETRGQNMFDDDLINGFVVHGRDISVLKRREQKLEQQNERLRDVRNVITHDIMNPLSVIFDSLELYMETSDEEYLEKIENSANRINILIEQITKMAEQDTEIGETEQIALQEIAQNAWEMVKTEHAELRIDGSKEFEADRVRLQQAFENLFRNAVDHNIGEITIRVGTTETGIFVEDDGAGIPKENWEDIFKSGYTTSPDNTGFGLNIVKQIIVGHGWEIEVSESEMGGARFDINNISFKPRVYN